MFRFFATLVVTGLAVLGASAWWGGREAIRSGPSLGEPSIDGARPETTPPAEPAPSAERTLPARPPAKAPEPTPLPAIAAVPAPRPLVTAPAISSAPTRRLPAIPAPLRAAPERQARVAAPEPAVPGPIPAPFTAPPARKDVEETRIPEPGRFEEDGVDLARRNEDSYGQENVVWVEGDHGYGGNLDDLFVNGEPERGDGAAEGDAAREDSPDERAVAMSSHDASAARIRRLLDVYESLGSTR